MMSFSLSGGVVVYGFISPSTTGDTYPVIDPLYGIDGFRNVETIVDLDNIPTLRRRAGMVVGVSGGTIYYKLNPSPWNNTITDWTIFNSGGGAFTGGTVTGPTDFINGLTANTLTVNGVSITGDTYTTGGTYSNGTIDFYYNTGGGYQVVGLYTGQTSYVNSLTTGVGLSADTTTGDITIINTDPDQIVSISGGTGILTGGTYPNFEITNTLPDLEVTISGGTGILTGGTYPNFTLKVDDIYATSLTFNQGTYDLSIDGSNGTLDTVSLGILSGDLTITGGTYNPTTGTATFVNNSGGTFNVTGFLTGYTDVYTTGFTYNNNTFTINNTNGSSLTSTINTMTGLTVNGNLTVTGNTSLQGLTATTVSATTYYNLPVDVFTGGTVTGATNFTGGLTATTISGSSISAPGLSTQVVYNNGGILSANTGFTYNNINKISLGQSGTTITGNGEVALIRYTTGTEVGGIRVETSTAGVELGGSGYYDKVFTTNGAGIRFWTYVSGTTNAERMRITSGTGTNWGVGIGTTSPTATLQVSGTTLLQTVTGTTALFSGSGQNILTVIGSGNTTSSPLFTVQGSSGELFSVTDSLVGSLYSVNDISGLPILEVFSDNTILMGSYQVPSLNTTARVIATTGTTNVYSIPTSAYTGAFFDYTVSDGTNLRAGNIMSIWSGSSVNYTETQTTDFGNTSGLTFNMVVSSGNAILRTSGVTGNWTVKTIVRSI
jgi:hypothetical protein